MILALLLFIAQECVECHKGQALSQISTPMGQALQPAAESRFLKSKPNLRFSTPGYTYAITRQGNQTAYSVSDGVTTINTPLVWAVGYGNTGQTFLFQRSGSWYESAVSFYPATGALDWTPAHATRSRANLDEALGRKLDQTEARRCFGCHSTDAMWTSGGQLQSLKAGIACGQCHTGAATHAAAFKRGEPAKGAIAKLGSLGPEDLSAVCANCHPSWAEVAENGPRGVGNVRHQIYRLTGSRCYDTADRRISCAACHDVHEHRMRDVSFYDSKCNKCHASSHEKARQCRVAGKGCITCHMPKVEVPGLHSLFTDHRIRIAGVGDKYPD